MEKFFREIHAKLPPDIFEMVSEVRRNSKVTWDEFQVLAALILRNTDPEIIEEAKKKMQNGEWYK